MDLSTGTVERLSRIGSSQVIDTLLDLGNYLGEKSGGENEKTKSLSWSKAPPATGAGDLAIGG